jgi:hypothetical protein
VRPGGIAPAGAGESFGSPAPAAAAAEVSMGFVWLLMLGGFRPDP